MKIKKIVLRKLKMDLKKPFLVSFGELKHKDFIVAEVHSGNHIGYGDCSAMPFPYYSEETNKTAWHILEDYLIPLIYSQEEITHPEEVYHLFKHIRRNNMAKSALDCAIWDLYAKEQGIPLAQALGGVRKQVETGVSIGIQESPEALVEVVRQHRAEGYKRVKVKIKPGSDLAFLKAVREEFPEVMLMADANSAYTLKDIGLFKELDKLNMIMIEQPLSHDDIVDHAKLQAEVNTRICLDESIHSVEDARKAIELGSTGTINIKVARVGGLTAAKKIQALCAGYDIPVWCGGMVDSGIGRAHNIAAATLPNYQFPNDIPASDRYYIQDFVTPDAVLDSESRIHVLDKPGIGFEPIPDIYERYTYERKEFLRPNVLV
ncbi:o-succinylbenzoate synthase [Terribacillus sp. 7520-G]|uniref:o-succinylbenzoate synthase n=1 Tax=Terribacillus TaxID=459532 RepID=UPI000BA501E7|nr:o-succinylbenzoate synthase [Terribacillus sp. 7520-G]PAD37627.1 o-succinylbenzoate synthase [Terribacillus sp. 7520-G]